MHGRTVLAAVVLAALPIVTDAPATAAESGVAVAGDISTEQRFVPDVAAQFNALTLRPEGLGFDRGSSPNPSFCKHYQGVVRKDGPDGTPYLFVTKSGNAPSACPQLDDSPGNLLVVRMGSRETTGERLRSNRLRRNSAVGYDPPTLNTPPDSRDVVVRTISFDGGANWPAHGGTSGWPAYGHPGAMQLVGDVLAVAMETPYEGAAQTSIAFFDVSNPENPRFLNEMYPGPAGDDFGAGTMGIAPVRAKNGDCCDYLMAVMGRSNRLVKFFKSFPVGDETTTDPTGPTDLTAPEVGWIPLESYTESDIEADGCLGTDWPSGSGEGLQSLSFVRQGNLDGPLFLVGAHNNVPGGAGDDALRLYEVLLSGSCPFRQRNSRRVTTYPAGGFEDSANFAAGTGSYVSPSGELIVYATNYANTGEWVPFAEYRHRDLVRPGSPTLRPTASIDGPFVVDEGSSVELTGSGAPALTQAWIQLFEDDGAGATIPKQFAGVFDSEWWLTAEYLDRDADDFGDLDALDHDSAFAFDLDFEENAESWRWFAPPGCTISANDYPDHSDEFPGPDTVLLTGTGGIEQETDLGSLRVLKVKPDPDLRELRLSPVPDGAGVAVNYDDDIEGVTFFHVGADGSRTHDCESYYGAAIGLGWDLDADGSFETSGTSVTSSAATLDGPTTDTVYARGTHPTDTSALGTGAPVPVPISVQNVAPRVEPARLTDSLGTLVGAPGSFVLAGLPLTLDVTFTDPGIADAQTAEVDWGDGTAETSFDSFSDANGGVLGRLEQPHTFASPGTHEVVVTITDDDGGATPVTVTIEVLSPAAAIEQVADELTGLIDSAPNASIASALRAARDDLIGNRGGTPPTNGALDKLDADDPEGAITKLRAAISNLLLAEARGAGDLSAVKDLLGLTAEAVAAGSYSAAEAAVAPPSTGEARALGRIADLITQGHERLGSGRYLDACDSFRQATARALDLSGGHR
jgi:hypothetical protein